MAYFWNQRPVSGKRPLHTEVIENKVKDCICLTMLCSIVRSSVVATLLQRLQDAAMLLTTLFDVAAGRCLRCCYSQLVLFIKVIIMAAQV